MMTRPAHLRPVGAEQRAVGKAATASLEAMAALILVLRGQQRHAEADALTAQRDAWARACASALERTP